MGPRSFEIGEAKTTAPVAQARRHPYPTVFRNYPKLAIRAHFFRNRTSTTAPTPTANLEAPPEVQLGHAALGATHKGVHALRPATPHRNSKWDAFAPRHTMARAEQSTSTSQILCAKTRPSDCSDWRPEKHNGPVVPQQAESHAPIPPRGWDRTLSTFTCPSH